MMRLGSRFAPLRTLPARVLPLVTRGRNAVAATVGAAVAAVVARVRAMDLAGLWTRLREDRRPLPEKIRDGFHALATSPRVEAMRERVWRLRTWVLLHDTAPREGTARRREQSMERHHRHEQREVERQHRREEHAKWREKKDEEERQAHSVYFE